MGYFAELDAERGPDDANAALHFDLVAALTRVAKGQSTIDDARLLCYACDVDLAEIGLWPKHERSDAFDLLNSNPTQQEPT